jgi:hypothetical protein
LRITFPVAGVNTKTLLTNHFEYSIDVEELFEYKVINIPQQEPPQGDENL